MAKRYFGEVPGIAKGTWCATRREIASLGLHRPTMAGVSGTKAEGADSIVVSGGYEDDQDFGDEIFYTGAGGNDPNTGKQIADQSIDQHGNAGLVTSQNQGLPLRLIRGSSGDPSYSPATGYRYDGLFRVTDHWSELGKSGYRVWRYRLVRLSDIEEAPYLPRENLPAGKIVPKTSTGVVTRTVRSTAVSRAVKRLYQDTCQICGVQLEIPGGRISEGAHIRALGKPHLGPDVPENVLCLCPNHHTLFDEGGILITDDLEVKDHQGRDAGLLHVHTHHKIAVEHLSYHRQLWGS